MNVNELILMIFPIGLFVLLLWGMKRPEVKGEYFENPIGIDNAKAIKGFAAIGIILHHLVQKITEYGGVYRGPVTIFNWMGILFTSIFFFFSGYGLIVSKIKKEGYVESFLKNRMPAVLIPFCVSNIIYFIVVGIYNAEIDNALDVLLSLTGIRLINTNTWFIVEIIILYLIFYLASRKFKDSDKVLKIVLISTIVMVTVSLFLGHDYHDGAARNPFQGEWWYNTIFLFYLGMRFGLYEDRYLERLKRSYKWLMPVAACAFVLIYACSIFVTENVGYYQEWPGHPGYGAKFVTLLVQSIACILFMLCIVLVSMKLQFGNRAVLFVGGISLELYIIHDLVKRAIIDNGRDGNDVAFFAMVLMISGVLAYLLNLLDNLLIRLWKGRKAYFADVPESFEGLERYNKVKRIYNTCKISAVVLMVIIVVFACIDVYGRLVTPKTLFEQEIASLKESEVGQTVYFGTYEMDYLNDVDENVPWIVLDRQDNRILLVTENVIERFSFNQEYEDTDWNRSYTRKLLNDEFYKELFNKYERTIIAESMIDSICTDGSVSTTKDKVFFLSKEEALKYFADDKARKSEASSAAKDNGVNASDNHKASWWWLRDMCSCEKAAYTVKATGEIDEDGELVSVASGGIRPAIWVVLE